MKPAELHIAESLSSFGNARLRAELIRLIHVGEQIETRLSTCGGAVEEFVANSGLENVYSTDVLLEELDELARNFTAAAHLVASIRGQLAVLRMDRVADAALCRIKAKQ